MSEVEQLRKEINELRERIAKLEAKPSAAPQHYIDWTRPHGPTWVPAGLPHAFPSVIC